MTGRTGRCWDWDSPPPPASSVWPVGVQRARVFVHEAGGWEMWSPPQTRQVGQVVLPIEWAGGTLLAALSFQWQGAELYRSRLDKLRTEQNISPFKCNSEIKKKSFLIVPSFKLDSYRLQFPPKGWKILSVSKITYLLLSTGHNNKDNPLIGVEHSFFIFIIPKGTKQVHYYWDTQYVLTRRYGGLRPPTSSSCGGLRGPFGPPDMWGSLF